MKRNINGIVILDKPIGISSNLALQKVKRLFAAKKAGHTGSLDPLATGLLPICFGEATKFSQFLLDADKTYSVSMRLGIRTATSDAEGEVVSERPVPADLTLEKINILFDQFRGDTKQVPSMYSALKYNGRPLYELARQGITVERQARPITIFNLNVSDYKNATVDFIVHCSKGTYVRTLVDDFGELLGCGAHVTALRRLSAGPFCESQMQTLSVLELKKNDNTLDNYILPIDAALQSFPAIVLSDEYATRLLQGQVVVLPQAAVLGLVRLLTNDQQFIGMGDISEGGKVTPNRMIQR